MTRFLMPPHDELDAVKTAFSEFGLLDQMNENGGESTAITPSRLLAFVRGNQTDSAIIKRDLLSNPSLRRVYRRMLEDTATYVIPEAIAASTDEFPERQVGRCHIRVVPSRAGEDRFYIIIEGTEEAASSPGTLVICAPDDRFEQVPLPMSRQGVIQVMVDESSGVPAMLRNPKSAIFLR